MNYLPNKLLKLRKHYNYSQAYIANVLDIDVSEYMAIENGRKVLNYMQCKKIANLYHVGVMEIFKNSEEVTLYEVSKAKTDELNIEYFLPEKTLKEKILSFIRKNSVIVGVATGIVILGLITIFVFANKEEEIPYTASLVNINRLSVSDTTVVYISKEGAVKGSGDNTNGQLSNLTSSGAIKVCEGSSFTIVLNDDGTVSSFGLINEYEKEISKWENIVDISVGYNHIVGVNTKGKVFAIGDNSFGQCDINNDQIIKKVYASSNGTILLTDEGKIINCGEFVGSSQLKSYSNILDIDTSDDNLVLLTSDGKVDYITKSKNFLNIYKWNNVVDVACGDEFISALCKDGTVLIDTEDATMINEVSNWKNIIAISAANDYLIAYDGENIFGTGKNNYHQFEKEEVEQITLAQVSGVKISIGNTIDVSFDKVINAIGYEVKLTTTDDQYVYKVSSNQTVSFEADKLEDGTTYLITITALGDNTTYLDSKPLEANFVFTKEKENNELIEIDKDFEGMTVEDFKVYIKSIGVPDSNVIGVETGFTCEKNVETIVSVDGLSKGQRISRSELNNAKVTYNYCRINTDEKEENNNE